MDTVKLIFDCVVQTIPDGDIDSPDFVEWCKRYDVHPLKGDRRGWWSEQGMYIRDNKYVIYLQNVDGTILMTEEEFEQSKLGDS